MAKILGKEEALFVMTGTMGNLLCILRLTFKIMGFVEHQNNGSDSKKLDSKSYSSLCGRGEEVICGHMSHISKYEQGNISQFGGVPFRTIPNELDGRIDIKNIQSQGYFSNDDFHSSQTKGFTWRPFQPGSFSPPHWGVPSIPESKHAVLRWSCTVQAAHHDPVVLDINCFF